MKHHTLPWIRSFVLLLLIGIVPVLYSDSDSKDKSGQVSQAKTLPHFNRIVLSGIGNLFITQAREQNLVVKAEAYLLPNIEARVDDETLYIDFKNASDYSRAEVNYYLSIKDLKSIQTLSLATVKIEDGLETEELTLEIKSFGEMDVKLDVNKLIVRIEGAGKIKANGRAGTQEINITGAGEFIGPNLKGDSVLVNITGTGEAKVRAQDKLSVSIPGDGAVEYCGSPSVSKELSGKGRVEQLPKKDC